MNVARRPTPDQELLLRAAVSEGPAVVEAWRQWRARVDLDGLDQASLRLVPQLFRNLERHGVADPWLGKLKGIYRYTWSRNQLMLQRATGVLAALRDAGIETLVLKGMALARLHYRDDGARHMDDVDVLVPWRQASAAMEVLTRCGWASPAVGPPTHHIPYRHAIGFREPRGAELDLHWNVLLECCGPDRDEGFWRGAVPLGLAGVTARALCPADQLLHVCVLGAWWSARPMIRWIADAMMVMRTAGSAMDWHRLVDTAVERRLVVATERALAYLAAHFAAPVPDVVLARLRGQPRSYLERLEVHVRARDRSRRMLGDLPMVVCLYLRLRQGASPVTLGEYLQYHWGLRRPADVPVAALAKAMRRLVRVPRAGVARGRPHGAAAGQGG